MLRIEVYREIEGLIKFLAVKFGAPGHFALDPEELIAEGRLVFAKVLKSNPELEDINFTCKFRTSLYNHFKSLLDKHRYTCKRGYTAGQDGEDDQRVSDCYIDLSDVADSIGYQAFTEVYYQEYVAAVAELIKELPDARLLFEVCVNPPQALEDLALFESKRKAHLAKQGVLVRNAEIVRVKQKHVAQFLGWSTAKVTEQLQILRKAADKVIFGLDQNICGIAV